MSRNRRAGGTGAVRGPASALTSFLAGLGVEPPTRLTTWDTSISNNEQAVPIDDTNSSIPEPVTDPAGAVTARTVVAGPSKAGEGTPVDEDESAPSERQGENARGTDSPPSKRRRTERVSSVDSEDLDAEWTGNVAKDNAIEPSSDKVKPQPLKAPGEFMNCGECTKKFTVTAYTKEHPTQSSTWLCVTCCYALGIDPFAKPKKASKPKPSKKEERAKVVHYEMRKGALSLGETCIHLIGRYIEDVEQLGDIGSVNMDKVCKIISKSRRLTHETASLFYSVERTDLAMYDCTPLTHESYVALAKLCPNLATLHLHLCGQLSTDAVKCWGKHLKHLRRLELFAPFLVRKEGWLDFLDATGRRLEGFLITQSPRVDLEIVEKLVEYCPNIFELRLSEIGQMNDVMLRPLSKLKKLKYLDISAPGSPFSDEAVITLLEAIGEHLNHLDLSDNPDLSDDVLSAIAAHCPHLQHLILRNVTELTDEGVANFFTAMSENDRPGLRVIDLEKGHDLKNNALRSLVAHSGDSVEKLSLLGWREVESESLEQLRECHSLQELDLGWCRHVTDFSLKGILDSCEQIKTIHVWGCNQLSDAVPKKKGVKVIGIETHSI